MLSKALAATQQAIRSKEAYRPTGKTYDIEDAMTANRAQEYEALGWDPELALLFADFTSKDNDWALLLTKGCRFVFALLIHARDRIMVKLTGKTWKEYRKGEKDVIELEPLITVLGEDEAAVVLDICSALAEFSGLADEDSFVGRNVNRAKNGFSSFVKFTQTTLGKIGFVRNVIRTKPVFVKVVKYMARLARWVLAAIVEEKLKRINKIVLALFTSVESIVKMTTSIMQLDPDETGWLDAVIIAGKTAANVALHVGLSLLPTPVAVVAHTAINAFGDTSNFVRFLKVTFHRRKVDYQLHENQPLHPSIDRIDYSGDEFPATPKGLGMRHNGLAVHPEDMWQVAKEFTERMPSRGRGSVNLVTNPAVTTMGITSATPLGFLTGYVFRVQPKRHQTPETQRWDNVFDKFAKLLDGTAYPVVVLTREEILDAFSKFSAVKKSAYVRELQNFERGGYEAFDPRDFRPNMMPKAFEQLRFRIPPGTDFLTEKYRLFAGMKPAAAIPVFSLMTPLTKSIFAAIRAGEWHLTEKGLSLTRSEDSLLITMSVKISKTIPSMEETVNMQAQRVGLHICGSTDDQLFLYVGKNGVLRTAGTDLNSCDLTMRDQIHYGSQRVIDDFVLDAAEFKQHLITLHSGKRKTKFKTRVNGKVVEKLQCTYKLQDTEDGIYTNSGGKNTTLTGQLGASGATFHSLERWAKKGHGLPGWSDLSQESEILTFVSVFERTHKELGLSIEFQPKPFSPHLTAAYLSCSMVFTDKIYIFPTSHTKLLKIKRDPTRIFPGTLNQAVGKYLAASSCNPVLNRTPEGRAMRKFFERSGADFLDEASALWKILRERSPEYEFNPIHNAEVQMQPLDDDVMSFYFDCMYQDGLYTSDIGVHYQAWIEALSSMNVGDEIHSEWLTQARTIHYGAILE
jgi:hypothetical protein